MRTIESLENLNVSEECFDEIVSLIEDYVNIFGKRCPGGDLLSDVDRGLGSPVKKAKDTALAKVTHTAPPKPAPKSSLVTRTLASEKTGTEPRKVSVNMHKDKSVGPVNSVKNAVQQAEG